MPDITISMTAEQATRVAAAIGEAMGLKEVDNITPKPATLADVKQFTISMWRSYVLQKERQDYLKLQPALPFEPT
jgi:hypothetical protein